MSTMNALAIDLRQQVAKTLLDEALEECAEQWRKMHRNAHLRGNLPDIESDREWELFWDWLNDDAGLLIQDIQEVVKRRWGFDWRIYSWGRQGATWAPDGILPGMHRHFNTNLDPGCILDMGEYERLEEGGDPQWILAYETARNHAAAFSYLNNVVRTAAQGVSEWWADMKAGNPETFEETED